MTNKTVKAVRATIFLGNNELDVFQLPCGAYLYSQTQAFMSITDESYDTQQAAKRYIEITTSKKALELVPQGFQRSEKIKIEGENQRFNGISQTDVMNFWMIAGVRGNKKAIALITACGIEALERRADAAFGVKRSEEERNQRFEVRRAGILSRTFWTDVIEEYIKTHEVSDNYKRFIYVHVSNIVNKTVFGLTAKEVREHYDLRPKDPVRDFLPSKTLHLIDTIEKASGVRVQNNNVEPKQAMKDVLSMLGLEPNPDLL